jgi:hypothetical protein
MSFALSSQLWSIQCAVHYYRLRPCYSYYVALFPCSSLLLSSTLRVSRWLHFQLRRRLDCGNSYAADIIFF